MFHSGAARVAFLGILPVLFDGCAKVGEPQPPVIRVAKPPGDLAVRQYGDRVQMTLSLPAVNTDGSPVVSVGPVEVFRCSMEATDFRASMTEAEFLKLAESVLVITPEKLASYLRDKTLRIEDSFSGSDRADLYRRRFQYAVRFVNRRRQTAGLTNRVSIAPVALPDPPSSLSFQVTQEFVRVSWSPPIENSDHSRPPHIVGYNIYRSEDRRSVPVSPLNPEPLKSPVFEDRNFEFDRTYLYAVSVVGKTEDPYAESGPSAIRELRPRDTFPPAAPMDLNAVPSIGRVVLLWTASPALDVAGYRVYRKEDREPSRVLLQQELTTTFSYRDEKVQSGNRYEYWVSAVDRFGNEGPPVSVIVEVP